MKDVKTFLASKLLWKQLNPVLVEIYLKSSLYFEIIFLRGKLGSVSELETRMSADYLRKEVDARILIKDLATKADVSRDHMVIFQIFYILIY